MVLALPVATTLVVAACSHSPDLTGGAWTLGGFGTFPPGEAGIMQQPSTSEYTITFNADGSVAVATDCINVVGTYTIDASSRAMTITLEPSDRSACTEDSLTDAFLGRLALVSSYAIFNEGTVLTLFLGGYREMIFDHWPDEPTQAPD